MTDKKASNRENYQKPKKHDNQKKKFALHEMKFRIQDQMIDFNKKIKQNCNCVETEIPQGQKHQEKCPYLECVENQQKQAFLRKNYVDFKTTFSYYRGCSPEWRQCYQIIKREQFEKDKVKIQQQIVKGKYFREDHLN